MPVSGLSSINFFLWDDETADEDRAQANKTKAEDLKTMLSQINASYPTTGLHKELVERYVGAMQMKRALEEGVIDSDDEDEGEDGAEDIEKMMKLMKSTKRAVKDMGKTMTTSMKLAQRKHKFVRVENNFSCGACTGADGSFCGRKGARYTCEECRVPLCTKLTCWSHHANTGTGRRLSDHEEIRVHDNQGGTSNENKATRRISPEEETHEEVPAEEVRHVRPRRH